MQKNQIADMPNTSNNTYIIGKKGEELAASELSKQGITIIKHNYKTIYGEIDLIGIKDETIIFIEVKNWKTYSIDSLERSLNKKKLKRITETSKYFLKNNRKYNGMAVRFDVVFIEQGIVNHIPHAWTENL